MRLRYQNKWISFAFPWFAVLFCSVGDDPDFDWNSMFAPLGCQSSFLTCDAENYRSESRRTVPHLRHFYCSLLGSFIVLFRKSNLFYKLPLNMTWCQKCDRPFSQNFPNIKNPNSFNLKINEDCVPDKSIIKFSIISKRPSKEE